jgi:hypothetical protein
MRWLLMALCCVASAQDVGSISGTVTDPSGAVIVDVVLTLRSADRQVADTRPDNTGTFQFNAVTPGEYQIIAVTPGFKTAIISRVQVRAGETAQVPVPMQVIQWCGLTTLSYSSKKVRGESRVVGRVAELRAGVDVTLTDLGTGSRLSTKTDSTGAFVFPSVPAGSFHLSASMEQLGFMSEFKVGAQQEIAIKRIGLAECEPVWCPPNTVCL